MIIKKDERNEKLSSYQRRGCKNYQIRIFKK